uniref:Tc1-like transposase DDE domain-containing protein n=1 Tax=Oncorhynchus tshawytscha TaxID=74940 RepID=A0AAZ3QIE7_ONCTS
MDNDPKHTYKVVAKWLKDNKAKVLEWSSQSPDLNPIENMWAELKKRVRARRPKNLSQLHHLCQEEWTKIHQTYCGKLVEGSPKLFTQVKQFKVPRLRGGKCVGEGGGPPQRLRPRAHQETCPVDRPGRDLPLRLSVWSGIP